MTIKLPFHSFIRFELLTEEQQIQVRKSIPRFAPWDASQIPGKETVYASKTIPTIQNEPNDNIPDIYRTGVLEPIDIDDDDDETKWADALEQQTQNIISRLGEVSKNRIFDIETKESILNYIAKIVDTQIYRWEYLWMNDAEFLNFKEELIKDVYENIVYNQGDIDPVFLPNRYTSDPKLKLNDFDEYE